MATISEALAMAIRHHQAGRLQAAEEIYRQILAVQPDLAAAHNNLGNVLKDQKKLDEALACYRRALELRPDYVMAHSNLVYTQLFCPGYDARSLDEEHRRWSRQHAEPLERFIQPHLNDRSPARRLRIGYLSPDFRFHPVGRFVLPLLESHDRESFQVFCYAAVLDPDRITERCRAQADVWRDVFRLSDEQVAHAVRRDQVDILVDLTMHMANNRLLVFARKPAPVQVTYLAYCGTTGLSAMDYRLTDPHLDPPGEDERFYSEQSVRLPETYWCYRPPIETPPVAALPAVKGGRVTFGCLNNFCKVTPPTLAAWSRLFQALPAARLLLHAHAGSHRDRVRESLTAQGISAQRLTFVDRLPTAEYFALYQRIDVALDPFPYGGGTTTCDALWMGVPVVSLAGQTAVGRGGVELKPDYADAHNNLGGAFKDQGKLDEAIACYRRALELKPDFANAHGNLLYTLNFCPGVDAQALYEEHRRWNRQHAEPLGKLIGPHANDGSPRRRLRIGYLSPDFRCHPVGRFLLPLLESHDHESFEVFCYASVRFPDPMTDRCRAHADVWRDVLGLPDEQVARTVRQDRTDILVDLTMHTRDNRLLVFARKPAPVQVTYLAYCGTTGLDTMDYRLTDPYLDPPGRDERFYCEQSVRLPETYWCYRPSIETPPVNALPASEAGQVSFGSLNNFCKVTPPVLAAWSRLLQTVPGSRLLLHARAGSHRDRVRGLLAQQGISAQRLEFVDSLPTAEYFGVYQRIDVALDPFPYGGGTTTCDALWMGVPVVSLAGQTAVGRGGVSILSNVGLPDLVAQDSEQYVRIAVELAQDLSRLSHLRATLRDRMQASPLMDAPRFARNVEAAYREMWRRWCAK